MVEYDVATYLADKLGLVLGTDIFANCLPEDVDYGVYVRVLDEEYEDGKLSSSIIGTFICKGSYFDCRNLAVSVKDALCDMKGMDTWTTGSHVNITNLGTNARGDEMLVVTANVFFNNGGN